MNRQSILYLCMFTGSLRTGCAIATPNMSMAEIRSLGLQRALQNNHPSVQMRGVQGVNNVHMCSPSLSVTSKWLNYAETLSDCM